jgi:hypothetical protein
MRTLLLVRNGTTDFYLHLLALQLSLCPMSIHYITRARADGGAAEVLYLEKEVRGVTVQAALRWSRDAYSESLQGFANGIRTADGGSHLDGLKSAVTKTVNAFAKKVRRHMCSCLWCYVSATPPTTI